MILKLDMKHQAMQLYKVCINHDPDLFHGKVNLGHPCILMGKIGKYHLMAENLLRISNWTED